MIVIPPSTPFYVSWKPSDISSGTFILNSTTRNFSDYSGYCEFTGGLIDQRAFRSADITEVETNAITLSNGAFTDCSLLSIVNLTECTSIGYAAFTAKESWSDGVKIFFTELEQVSMEKCKYISGLAFTGQCKLSNISLPYCSFIGSGAFKFCYSLEKLSLPRCITLYGTQAFAYCSALSQVNLPECTRVGGTAFENCRSLSQVSLPKCTSVGGGAFTNCESLSKINLPSCRELVYRAFYGCTSLTQVSLPVCSQIGENVFYNCTALSEIVLPKCEYIGTYAFGYCSSLSVITLGCSVVCSLSSYAFYGTWIETLSGSIYVPSSLVSAYKTADLWYQYSNIIYPIPS